MARKKASNINFMLSYVESFMEGKINRQTFDSDFPLHFEKCFPEMKLESPEFADDFNFYLVDLGFKNADSMTDSQYKRRIRLRFDQLLSDDSHDS